MNQIDELRVDVVDKLNLMGTLFLLLGNLPVLPLFLAIYLKCNCWKKWLGVNEKLPPKSGLTRSMWVRPSPSNLCIY
jgi:hypothetical protein